MKIQHLAKGVKTFLAEEEGLTIVEYAVGGALIAAGAVTAFGQLGGEVCDVINTLDNAVNGSTVVVDADAC